MYDLHARILNNQGYSDLLDIFGIRGMSFFVEHQEDWGKLRSLKKETPFDLVSCAEISSDRIGAIKKNIKEFRNNVDIILVNARSIEALRAASKESAIDIISNVLLDNTTAREVSRNSIAVSFFKNFFKLVC